jgi:hypothetical protein
MIRTRDLHFIRHDFQLIKLFIRDNSSSCKEDKDSRCNM